LIVSGCRERQYGRRVRLASAPGPTRILRSAPGPRHPGRGRRGRPPPQPRQRL